MGVLTETLSVGVANSVAVVTHYGRITATVTVNLACKNFGLDNCLLCYRTSAYDVSQVILTPNCDSYRAR